MFEATIKDGLLIRYEGNDKEVKLPEGIKKIGTFAFEGCTILENIIFPNSLTEIGEYAFKDCTNLSQVRFPSSIKNIEYGAFEGCINLQVLEISSFLNQQILYNYLKGK